MDAAFGTFMNQSPSASNDPNDPVEDRLEAAHHSRVAYIEHNKKLSRIAIGLSVASAWVGVIIWIVML